MLKIKRKYTKYTLSDKQSVIKLHQNGKSYTEISELLSITRTVITKWIKLYILRGEEGLKNKIHGHYSSLFKYKLVLEYHSKQLSLNDIALKYNISNYAIFSWVRKYSKDESSFSAIDLPLIPPFKSINMGRNKKLILQTELEQLRAENEYLKIEVALLKKVKALAEKKKNQLKGAGWKLSKS